MLLEKSFFYPHTKSNTENSLEAPSKAESPVCFPHPCNLCLSFHIKRKQALNKLCVSPCEVLKPTFAC
jgi:hypothetical protein